MAADLDKNDEQDEVEVEMQPLKGIGMRHRSASNDSKDFVSYDMEMDDEEDSQSQGSNRSNSHRHKNASHSSSNNGDTKSKWKVISACTLQTACSCSMVLLNKHLASSYNHHLDPGVDLNVSLVVFQAFVAVVSVWFCKHMNWIEDYGVFQWRTAKLWAPVNLLFCGMLFSGMASLQHNTVPMVTVFKNVANIFITYGDWHYFNTPVEFLVKLAFGIMLAGACCAAIHDVHVTPLGMFWMMVNCLTTAGYVLYMKFATNTVKLSKFGMVYYNNVLCIAFLLPGALVRGEWQAFMDTDELHTNGYLLWNVFAGALGFLLNFSSLHCVAVTGPTTYAIVGSLNKIPVSLFGYLLFKATISRDTWFFMSVSLAGGFLYSYAKIISSNKKEAIVQVSNDQSIDSKDEGVVSNGKN